jgi:hypothetical protein
MSVMSPDRARSELADRTDVIGPEQGDLLEKALGAWIERRQKKTPISEKVALRAVWAELIGEEAARQDPVDDYTAASAEAVRALSDLAQSLDLMRRAAVPQRPEQPEDAATLVPTVAREQDSASLRVRTESPAMASSRTSIPENHWLSLETKSVASSAQPKTQRATYLDRVMLGAGRTPSIEPPEQTVTHTPNAGGDATTQDAEHKPAIGKTWGASLRVAAAVALILLSVGSAQLISSLSSSSTLTAERQALDGRAMELTSRATRPGSALSCLDAVSGDTVEAFCEKTLFATPEAVTASMSYVAAQLSLLADATDYMRRGGTGYELVISNLRHAAETDRFGIVAHVLSQRDGCSTQRCSAFAFLSNTDRVRRNLAEATFERTVGRYTETWPAVARAPPEATVAAKQTPAGEPPPSPPPTGVVAAKPPRRDLFFPSAKSIPPINIMVAEPAEARPNGPAAARAPTPPTPPARPQAQ